MPDDDATVGVIFENLKVGLGTLFGTPIIRSLFIVGAFMFVAFGLWNVLLLPFSINAPRRDRVRIRPAGGSDLGRLRRRIAVHGPLRAPAAGTGLDRRVAPGHGRRWASSTPTRPRSPSRSWWSSLSGFAPAAVVRSRRSVLLQRNTPREMRGRVFSAFYVMRDIIFLIGMAGAGLADFVDIRLLIIVRIRPAVRVSRVHARRPRTGYRTWGAAAARLRGAGAPQGSSAQPGPCCDAGRLRPPGGPSRCLRPALG